MLQSRLHFVAGLQALVRVFPHHGFNNILKHRWYISTQFLQRRWVFVLVGGNALCQGSFGERRVADEQKVQRATKAVDVGSQINAMAVDGLFGRQVVRRAHYFFVV